MEKRSTFGWPATTAGYAPCNQGLVVHYDGSNQGLAGKEHSACRSYWKNTRQFHMGPSRGWRDIGYSFAVCPHGVVMEGRGWQREQAAQPSGNTTWTSVTFMSGDAEKPTDAQITAFRDLRAWLRGKGLGSAVKGHRDFISTSCPGSILYSMVKSGALISGSVEKEDDDDMLGLKKGDKGERVKLLQLMIQAAGQGAALGKSGIDGEYGASTAEALRLVRKSVGSNAEKGFGDKVDSWALQQLHAAVARNQGKQALQKV